MNLPDTIRAILAANNLPESRIEATIRAMQGEAIEATVSALASTVAPKRRGRPPKDRSTLEGMIAPFRMEDFSTLVQADLIWAFGEIQAGRTDRGEKLIKGACRAKRDQRVMHARWDAGEAIRPVMDSLGRWIWPNGRPMLSEVA
jgi:hypothetical protein